MKKLLVIIFAFFLIGGATAYAEQKAPVQDPKNVAQEIQIFILQQKIKILEQAARIKELEDQTTEARESDMEAAAEVGDSANSYTVNATPSTSADYLLGIDAFAGSWAVQRFNIAELLKLVTAITGPITIGTTGDPADTGTGANFVNAATMCWEDATEDCITHVNDVGFSVNRNISAATYGSDGTITDAELLNIGTIAASTISANQWAALGGIAETLASAELNYLDIASLGTGAASKAVVLDGSGNYTAPAGTWSFAGVTGITFTAQPITTTGIITGKIQTATDADAHTLSEAEYHGGTVVATGAAVHTLPAAAAGYSGCVENGQGVTSILQLLPGADDYIVFKGARGTAATSIKSPTGVAGSRICYRSYDADDWYVTTESATSAWAE